jgi:hypothetical protein
MNSVSEEIVSEHLNKHEKLSRSPGPSCIFVAETKLNNLTWCQAGLSRGCVDYSENGEHTDTQKDTHTQRFLAKQRDNFLVWCHNF